LNNLFKIVFLVGMPGVGKTFYGRYAALKLGIDFFDLDEEIEKFYHLTVFQIFKTNGEDEFRLMEHEILEKVINKCNSNTIIATGGGTPCYNNNLNLMNDNGNVVWLNSSLHDILAHISTNLEVRPMFEGIKLEDLLAKMEEMLAKRIPYYSQTSLKLTVYRGLDPDLFTKRLQLSTFAK